MRFWHLHEDPKKHRGCDGFIRCCYTGLGEWEGVCSVCGKEVPACGPCRALSYPPTDYVLAKIPEGFAVPLQRGEDTIYRCPVCGLGYGPETLYKMLEHLEGEHQLSKYLEYTDDGKDSEERVVAESPATAGRGPVLAARGRLEKKVRGSRRPNPVHGKNAVART